jgi:glycolate dehydrogenase FAD-binding subunit
MAEPAVATPADTAEAAEILRDAARNDLAVLIRGGGTKIDWGVPPRRVDLIVDTGRLTGVVEHAAGDLITVVRAGTTMTDLAAALTGQQLALDVPLPGATVGGTVAVNTSGPRRMLYGTVRDLLIGITVVRPDGKVAHAGGKVVKNVAGYDLGKLFTGAYGTLGLITECAFRLHPLPAARAVVHARVADPGRVVAAVLGAQVVPSALEINAPPDGEVEVAVLVEGSAAGVRDRAATLAKLLDGESSAEPPPWWGRYPWGDGDVGLKLTAPLSKVPDLLAAARESGAPLTLRGSAGTGVLYAGLPQPRRGAPDTGPPPPPLGDYPRCSEQSGPGDSPRCSEQSVVEYLRAAAVRGGGHAVVLTAPPGVRETLDMWGPVAGLALMRRVKDQFDPGHRFAPGSFVGGI